jgi:hypothetical protein
MHIFEQMEQRLIAEARAGFRAPHKETPMTEPTITTTGNVEAPPAANELAAKVHAELQAMYQGFELVKSLEPEVAQRVVGWLAQVL